MNRFVLVAGIGALLGVVPAQATLLFSMPSGGVDTVLPGATTSCSSAGVATVGGFAMSSDTGWCRNYSGGFGFGTNGQWLFGFNMVGLNNSAGTISIDLGGLYSTVGSFMNYSPGSGTPVISAIAADGVTVLESYNLSVSGAISTPAGSNAGAYRGIQRATTDIRYFQISGAFIGIHDIDLVAIPEPGTWLLTACGVIGLALSRKRWRV